MTEAKPVARGRPVKTALHQAVLDRRIHQVRLLVSKHHVNVDLKDMYGRTALTLACLINNEEHGNKMVKIFLKAGAYPNVKDNTGRTALSYACLKGHEDIVRVLIHEDITDVNTADKDGNTPLMYAVVCGKPSITKLLVDKMLQFSMTVDVRNVMGYTPFLLACKYGHYGSGHYLLTVGKASPLLRDNEYFLNARDWLKRGHSRSRRFMQPSRSYDAGSSTVGVYDRDHSTYSVTRSMEINSDNVIRPSLVNPQEHELDGLNAREVLVKLVNEALELSGTKSQSRVRFHERPPGTAKLLALRGPTKAKVPSMAALFSIYSDQYDERMAEKLQQQQRGRKQELTAGLRHHLDPLLEASLEDVRGDLPLRAKQLNY